MRTRRWMVGALLVVMVGGCSVKVEDKGRAPDLGEGDPGELPKVDIDPAKVEISSDTQQVVTPEVKVTPIEGNDSAADRDSAR
jgi:hypothetical protein